MTYTALKSRSPGAHPTAWMRCCRITAVERVWGQRLTATATESGVRLWPLHLANDGELVAMTPDDLVALRSAAG